MRRARMPALSRPALFRTTLAVALAAITIPFIAHAASGDETVTAPTAQVFPTRQGIGITWTPVDASGYRVERKQGTADWQDLSGPLTGSTTTWIDETIPAGTTADYRVATTDSDPTTSPEVKATRVAEAPSVGDIDVLALDANRGGPPTWLKNEIASPVTASAPTDGSRTLAAGSLKVTLPAFVAGPGYYDLPSPTAVALTQGERSCTSAATLRVTAVSYTPDLQLETFAASLAAGTCEGADAVAWYEIRYRSALGYQALSITPERHDFGKVRHGEMPSTAFTLKSTGIDPVRITGFSIFGGGFELDPTAPEDCPSSLLPGATCTATVRYRASVGPSSTILKVFDSTALGLHSVTVSAYGVDVAEARNVDVRSTFNGHTVSWESLQRAGGTAVLGYNLHRYLNGAETTEWFPEKATEGTFVVPKPTTEPGTEYAVSVVNEVGEGPISTRLPVPRTNEQIVVTEGGPDDRDLAAADKFGHVVPFPPDPNSVKPKEAVASSPDGQSLVYVTNTTERTVWTQKVTPGHLGVPVKLWSSAAPITRLSWSPDGTRIAFQAPENDGPCVYVIAATGGTPTKIACQLSSPSWMPDARTLVVSDHRLTPSRLAMIDATAGGTRISTWPGQAEVPADRPVRVSADGQWVAYGHGSTVRLAGTTEAVSPTLDAEVRELTMDPSGGGFLLALTASGRVYQLVADGRLYLYDGLKSVTGRADVAWQRLGLTIKPTPAVMGPNISIPFDASALPTGTRFSCEVKGSFREAVACTSPFTTPELRSGTHQVVIRAFAPDGTGTVAFRNITVDATGPVARMTGPGYQSSVAATATLKVSATDPNGVASYDVQYRRATSAGPYGDYVQPWTNTTATSMSLAVAAGYEYCASVRAKDKFGNLGQWSADRCFSRPLDDRSLTLASTGWTRATGSTFYYGTTTQTTAYGKSLTRTVQGKRFFLVATRCPTCGSVAVYAGNRHLTTVNLAYPTTHRQVVLGLPVQSTLFSGTLKFVSASSGKLVQIDGLAVGRT